MTIAEGQAATTSRTAIGGNNPPLPELLSEQYKELLADAETLLGSAARAPVKIEDDDVLGKVGRLVVKLRDIKSRAKTAHKIEKDPHLTAGRQVDAFFNPMMADNGRLDSAIKGLERNQGVYIRAKEDAIRKAERERAAEAEAAAQALLRTAERAEDRGDIDGAREALDQAAVADTAAQAATMKAEAKPADVVRTYTSTGNVVSSQEKWDFEILNRAEIPLDVIRSWLPSDAIEKAVRAYVKSGGRELKGVRIYEDRKVVNR